MRIKRFVIGSLVLVAVAASTIAITFDSNRTSFYKISPSDSDVVAIDVSGAVLFKGKHYFKKGVKLKEILNVVKENNADLSNVDMNKEYTNNVKIFIPFLKNNFDNDVNKQIHWLELNDEQQLRKLGVSANVSRQLVQLRRNKSKVRWDDIRSLKGIGDKTFLKLKKVLIL
ncbi:Hypothetical protein, predicted transmembrane protein [Mycoplasmopsis agalactiae 14628]|uniref:Uncharacterized protein n=1 Tax=Mycoplasmopsis agalactiae 14628 TaxID=1110504 RepID=I5D5B6_MYCAA|nr:hypothetical protein [Mycoplasmopsis agalactiae]EIN14875.1 Hypothetical protein, predicted transmembrane protein [Mycoplasmopsis agalactiae 14628]